MKNIIIFLTILFGLSNNEINSQNAYDNFSLIKNHKKETSYSININNESTTSLLNRTNILRSKTAVISAFSYATTIWYADFDNDGYGDENNTIVSATQPLGYIKDCHFDDCPSVAGTGPNGCPLVNYNFDNQNQNYIYERYYLNEFKPNELSNSTDTDVIQRIVYFDGQRRVKQQNLINGASTIGNDIITHTEYDEYGLNRKKFLPYTNSNTNGFFDSNSETNTFNYYNTTQYDNTTNPYSESLLDESPLNKVRELGFPGEDWLINPNSDLDHTVKLDYQKNKNTEVELFRVVFPTLKKEEPQLHYEGYYPTDELYKSITKDENWQPGQTHHLNHTSEEFTDKNGRLILKRTYNNNINHDTYYIYDDFGNLTYVLSPKGSDLILYNNKYLDFSDEFKYSELIPLNESTNGNGSVTIELNSNLQKLFVNFDVGFSTSINLKNGPIGQLSSNIPNMIVGYITSPDVHYVVSVQEGYLYIAGEGLVSGVTNTFIVDLPNQSVNTEVLDNLCYQYHYDYRNRIVEKKIPQKGWEYIIYDKLDRPVLTQDVNLRGFKNWLFTKYDVYNRVAYTGLFSDLNSTALTRTELQELVNNQDVLNEEATNTLNYVGGWGVYHTNNALQLPSATMLWDLYTVNYYDTYNPELTAIAIDPQIVLNQNTTSNTTSLATGSKIRVLDTDDWTTNVIYYDDKARPIFTASKNDYLNTTDITKVQLDFVGKVIKTESSHIKDSNPDIMVYNDYTYDHIGRLLTQKQQIGNGVQELIAKNTYDELGRLITKGVGNTESSPLQNVDYKFNIRGWLTEINNPDALGSDLFGFKIGYNNPEATIDNYIQPQYNGNISETIWKSKSLNHLGNLSEKHAYNYTYDAMNRLTVGNFGFGDSYTYTGAYKEYIHSYDKNGNILKLYRNGKHATPGNNTSAPYDDLTYQYNGNQLTQVNDLYNVAEGYDEGPNAGYGIDYTYDDNGNMITDASKGITSIEYNHLNLPKRIIFNGNDPMFSSTWEAIEYLYDATGVKIEKVVKQGSTGNYDVKKSQYAGSYIYEEKDAITSLKFFTQSEGYVEPDGQGNFDYVYQYKDHLGNVRLSYRDANPSAHINISEDFVSGTYDWYAPGNGGSINNSSEKLNINLLGKWTSTGKYLTITPNTPIQIEFDFENGDMVLPTFFVRERINGVWEPGGNRDVILDIQNGHHVLNLTLTGDYIQVYFEKGNSTDDGTLTSCYVDNFKVTQKNLEILEENNYYPFGLKHKGYNYNVSANVNDLASKFKYNGVELENALGLDLYEMTWRNYNPSLGRFVQIDPFAEYYGQYDKSPFAFAWNNPVFYNDPSGLCPDCGPPGEDGDTFMIENGSVYVVFEGEWERQVEELPEIVMMIPSNTNTSSGGKSDEDESDEDSNDYPNEDYDDLPPTVDYKNGETITNYVDGNDFMLHANKWLKLPKEKLITTSAHDPMDPKGIVEFTMSREQYTKLNYDNTVITKAAVQSTLAPISVQGTFNRQLAHPVAIALAAVIGPQTAIKKQYEHMKMHDEEVEKSRKKN